LGLSFVALEPAPLLERPEDDEAQPPIKAIPSASNANRFNVSIAQLLEFDTCGECIFRTAQEPRARMGKNTARNRRL
jgi:hypothetical protein